MNEVSEQVVRTTAEICGPNSGAAKALQNADERRERGEQVRFFKIWNAILVQGQSKSAPVAAPEGAKK